MFFCVIWLLYYHTQFYLYDFTPEPYPETSPSANALGGQILHNLFPVITMGFFFWLYLLPAAMLFLVIEVKFHNLNSYLKIGLIATTCYFSTVYPLLSMHDEYYRVLFPGLLNFSYGEYIIPLVLVMVALGITIILKHELPETPSSKLTLVFWGVFYVLLIWALAPHLFSQEIIELRSTGREIIF